MAEALKEVSCDPKCGFSVKSHDEKEIMDIVKQHAKKSYNMAITDKDVMEKMKEAA